jgi:hypothetical protein
MSLTTGTWSPPVSRPKLCPEYASVGLEPVSPLPSYVVKAYTRYTEKREEMQAQKETLIDAISSLQSKLTERVNEENGKYRVAGRKEDVVTVSKRDEIAKQSEVLALLNRKMDALIEDNKAVEEYMTLHKKMEESYTVTKALQDESRVSWAAMYSSV